MVEAQIDMAARDFAVPERQPAIGEGPEARDSSPDRRRGPEDERAEVGRIGRRSWEVQRAADRGGDRGGIVVLMTQRQRAAFIIIAETNGAEPVDEFGEGSQPLLDSRGERR